MSSLRSTPSADSQRWSGLLAHWRGGEGPLYSRLSAALRGCIQDGRLGHGDSLPAERTLAQLLTVSRSTVVAALEVLEGEGWVSRRQGSGTAVAAHAPRRAELLELRSPVPHPSGVAELDLTIAVPTLGEAQQERLQRASVGAFRDSLYHPLGLPELRACLAEMYTGEGLPTSPEQVIVTSGAQQAISLITAAFVRRGDRTLLETPTYFGAIDVLRAAGASLWGVPVAGNGLQYEAFEAQFEAQLRLASPRLAFLTPTFQNPTGTVLPGRTRERLAHLVTDAGLVTIEDDTLIDLSFGATLPPRLSQSTPEGSVINVGSLSKLFWAGLRVGWLRAPRHLQAPLAQVKTLADFGSSLPAQAIALQLLGDLQELRQERRAAVEPARDILVRLLRGQLPDWTFQVPTGGQFLWAELPTRHVSGFTLYALSHGVRLFPGASMDVTDLPDRYLRLPFTLPPAQLPEAVRRLREAWTAYRERQQEERLA